MKIELPGGDDDVTQRYRDASAELDERPDASARPSILAAAAREVGAKPIDASKYRRARPRWPLAAAAAVMLSTLAVMMALRTEEEMPQFNAAPEPARSASADAAPASETVTPPSSPAATPIDEPTVAKRNDAEPLADRREQARNGRTARPQQQSGTRQQQPRAESAPPIVDKAREVDQTVRSRGVMGEQAQPTAPPAAAAQAATPPPAPPAPLAKQRAEEQEARVPARASEKPREDAAPRDFATRPSSSLGAAQNAAGDADVSAASWLERIIKLRREGRHEDADAELKRFRERYPQVQVPTEALPVTGTR